MLMLPSLLLLLSIGVGNGVWECVIRAVSVLGGCVLLAQSVWEVGMGVCLDHMADSRGPYDRLG
jgi:hypothetical protein